MARPAPPLSLYVHLPWCVRKCPYCDFNSHRAGEDTPFLRYVSAIVRDLESEASRAGTRSIVSIFLGGGTPSLFTPEQIDRILVACREHLELSSDCEITMEANPGTIERGSLTEYRAAGINRLSLGAQSFDAEMLRTLGRIHGPEDIDNAFREAQAAGFDSVNVDLMFALPGQDLGRAKVDLARLLDLSPSHVSYYQLTLEPNTVFYRNPPANMPEDGLAWDIQTLGQRTLEEAGFEQYEVSAFAKPGQRCRHNLNYWQFGDYLAVGAGAHGKHTDAGGRVTRYRKPANPMAFIETIEGHGAVPVEQSVAGADLLFEFMLNVLRLNEGFSVDLLSARTGLGDAAMRSGVEHAISEGLLESSGADQWRPTAAGRRFLNDLQAQFLP